MKYARYAYLLAVIPLLSAACAGNDITGSTPLNAPGSGSSPGGVFGTRSIADEKPTDNPLNSCNHGAPDFQKPNTHADALTNGWKSVDFVSYPVANADKYELEVYGSYGRALNENLNGKPQGTYPLPPDSYRARLRVHAESGNCGTGPGVWSAWQEFSVEGPKVAAAPAPAHAYPFHPSTDVG